jgi:hypothetical protein
MNDEYPTLHDIGKVLLIVLAVAFTPDFVRLLSDLKTWLWPE